MVLNQTLFTQALAVVLRTFFDRSYECLFRETTSRMRLLSGLREIMELGLGLGAELGLGAARGAWRAYLRA